MAQAFRAIAINSEVPLQLRRQGFQVLAEGPRGLAPRRGTASSGAGNEGTVFSFVNAFFELHSLPVPEHLAILEMPPTMNALQPLIDAYLAKIAEMQPLVVQNVLVNARMDQTGGSLSTIKEKDDCYKIERSIGEERQELAKWGIYLDFQVGITNTRHVWVTVTNARFKPSSHNPAGTLQRLAELSNETAGPYAEINAFIKRVEDYGNALKQISVSAIADDDAALEACSAERKAASALAERIGRELLLITKGAVSRSFVASLIYSLHYSLEMSGHPGD